MLPVDRLAACAEVFHQTALHPGTPCHRLLPADHPFRNKSPQLKLLENQIPHPSNRHHAERDNR